MQMLFRPRSGMHDRMQVQPVNTITLQEARDHLARKARGRASKAKGDAWESEVIAKAKACGWLVVQL